MNGAHSGIICERARAWAALAPDGELAELERKLLHAHIERCAPCAAFADDVAVFAAELRRAELVPLSRPLQIAAWRRSRYGSHLRNVGAVAAVALLALGVAARAPVDRHSPTRQQFGVSSSDTQAELAELRQLRRQELIGAAGLPSPHVRHFGNQPA